MCVITEIAGVGVVQVDSCCPIQIACHSGATNEAENPDLSFKARITLLRSRAGGIKWGALIGAHLLYSLRPLAVRRENWSR